MTSLPVAKMLWALHWKCEALRSWRALSWYSPGRAGHRSLAYYFRNIVPWSYQKYSWGYLTFHMEISFPAKHLADRDRFSPRLSWYSPRLSCSCPASHQGFGNYSLRGHGCKGSQALKLFVRPAVCKPVFAALFPLTLQGLQSYAQAGQVSLSHTASQWHLLLVAHSPWLSPHPVWLTDTVLPRLLCSV